MSKYLLRAGLPPLPRHIRALPVDERGYPVPYFVAWVDGKADFRLIDPLKLEACVKQRRCWICGQPLGVYLAFTIGPMCSVNRVSSEPPAHRDCAEFAVQACPFLTLPKAQRRDANIPEGIKAPAGIAIPRNPGVTLLWLTRRYDIVNEGNGVLFDVGNPDEVIWYAQGRKATRDEAWESFESGVRILYEVAETEGSSAIFRLGQMVGEAMKLLPAKPITEEVHDGV